MAGDVLVIMRCFNDEVLVGQTLDGIFSQTGQSIDVVAVDSGSADRSVEIIKQYDVRLIEIPPGTYIPGKVLNLGMEQGEQPLCAFVNSDCTPQHDRWLSELLIPLHADSRVAAVYGRQIPRPDAQPLVQKDYERAFGDGEIAAAWPHFFSMASSAIRRSVWRSTPFDPAIQYSEDVYWTWERRNEGWRIAYAKDSIAMHSHNYSLPEMRRRFEGEGRADSNIYPSHMLPDSWMSGVFRPWGVEVIRDLLWCVRSGNVRAVFEAPIQRWVQRSAYWRALSRASQA